MLFGPLLGLFHFSTTVSKKNSPNDFVIKGKAFKKEWIDNGSDNNRVDETTEECDVAPAEEGGHDGYFGEVFGDCEAK